MLAKTFGCARMVCNDAIRLRQDLYQQGEKVGDTELQKRLITQAKLSAFWNQQMTKARPVAGLNGLFLGRTWAWRGMFEV